MTQSEQGVSTQELLPVVQEEAARLRRALKSIANSACCGDCQEAALVAAEALAGGPVNGATTLGATTPEPTEPAGVAKPFCETCGKVVAEVLCPTCAKWWSDNPPPAGVAEELAAMSLDEGQRAFLEDMLAKGPTRLDIYRLFDAGCQVRTAADKMYWAVRNEEADAFKAAMTEYEQVVGLDFRAPDLVIGAFSGPTSEPAGVAGLADELEAAIEAWHDCAPGGQGEGWSGDATAKFNAMAQAFYDNSERICAALRNHSPLLEVAKEALAPFKRVADAIDQSDFVAWDNGRILRVLLATGITLSDFIRARAALQAIKGAEQ